MTNSDRKPSRVSGIRQAAHEALEAARRLEPGIERIEALKKAGLLRNEADKAGLIFAKRGRPAR